MSRSTLPPDSTIAVVRPASGIFPDRAAASATAPPGSTTSLRSRKARAIAASDFRVADRQDPGQQLAVDRERERPRRRRLQRIADRARLRRVPEERPGRERAARVVEGFRLDAVDGGGRRERVDRDGGPAGEAAAAGRNQHLVRRHPELFRLLHQLEADRALAGDHVRVVVGRHERRAALRDDPARDGLAVFGKAVVEHDLGAERARVLELHGGRVRRHHDGRRDAEHPGRRGDALGVVAGREGDDAGAALRCVELHEAVVGSAELEGAGALQRLHLEQDPAAQRLVERRRREQGRAPRDAGEPSGGRLHVGKAGQGREVVLCVHRMLC